MCVWCVGRSKEHISAQLGPHACERSVPHPVDVPFVACNVAKSSSYTLHCCEVNSLSPPPPVGVLQPSSHTHMHKKTTSLHVLVP